MEYVYADRSVSVKSTLKDAVITVINADGVEDGEFDEEGSTNNPLTTRGSSWYLRIELGDNVANTRRIKLYYKNARAPRIRAADDDKLMVQAFSDPDVDDDVTNLVGGASIPQHPVAEHKAITVTYAANGSGMVTFDYDGIPVLPFEGDVQNLIPMLVSLPVPLQTMQLVWL